MEKENMLQSLKGGLVVSCQAYPGEPLFGTAFMAGFSRAAAAGGAAGIRANSPPDIRAIKEAVDLPVIGIWKRQYPDSDVYITPTRRELRDIFEAGADIAAMDATRRRRPDGETLESLIAYARSASDCLLMADVSTLEEGVEAERLGFDIVSTTLAGYTAYSRQGPQPDLELVGALSAALSIPVFAEGRITTPDQALGCLARGACAVVVGGAITRPQDITQRFVERLRGRAAADAREGGVRT